MTGPWKNRPRDAIDTAMDVLVKLPGVLEEWDLISTRQPNNETLCRAKVFKRYCLEIDSELRSWYSNFVSLFGHEYPYDAAVLIRGMNCPAQQADIPEILARIGLHHLHAMTIYWTSCTILHATIDLVNNMFPAATDIDREIPGTAGTSILKYLILLGHSAKYFLRSELGLLGTLSISHTTTCLVRTLHAHQSCSPKIDPIDLEQLKHVMGVMRGLSGFETWRMWKCGMDDWKYDKDGTFPVYLGL